MSAQRSEDALAKLEGRLALLSIALRATELDLAVKTAIGADLSLDRERIADLRAEIEIAADEWLSINGITASKIWEPQP